MEIVPLAFFLTIIIVLIGFPLARASARRIDRGERVPKEVAARLERMEQALESVAIEVERISEGQRFTTKLLTERSSVGLSSARDVEQGR